MSGYPRGPDENFTLSWSNLTYTFHNGPIKRAISSALGTPIPEKRTIFKQIGGHVSSGQMIGILGPSGSGKTILLGMYQHFYTLFNKIIFRYNVLSYNIF